jgi:hypothetical protein
VDWVDMQVGQLEHRMRRTQRLEWRPRKRFMRLHDRRGRLEGLMLLRAYLVSGDGAVGAAAECGAVLPGGFASRGAPAAGLERAA